MTRLANSWCDEIPAEVQMISTPMGKDTCDSRRSFDIRFLQKHGYFNDGIHNGTLWWRNEFAENSISIYTTINDHASWLTLNYKWHKDDISKVDMNYTVQLTTTPCHLGGKRWWFICPLSRSGVPCGRRAAKLYQFGRWFGCRICGDFAYDSQYERRSGYIGALARYYTLQMKLEARSPPRIKFWKGNLTKRFRKYLAMREALYGAASTFVDHSEKMKDWLHRKKTVE